MRSDLAKAALQFMLRVPLQGNEVGAFTQVAMALEEDAKTPPTLTGKVKGEVAPAAAASRRRR